MTREGGGLVLAQDDMVKKNWGHAVLYIRNKYRGNCKAIR